MPCPVLRHPGFQRRSMMKCPLCGKPVEDGAAFCPYCGMQLEPEAPGAQAAKRPRQRRSPNGKARLRSPCGAGGRRRGKPGRRHGAGRPGPAPGHNPAAGRNAALQPAAGRAVLWPAAARRSHGPYAPSAGVNPIMRANSR
ncbi:MAG: zinc ribbon domain-containing protein [Ruthenibacterium sp.]